MFQRLPFPSNVSISLSLSSEPGPFRVSYFLYMSALLLTSAPSFLCQPGPFVSSFNPVLSLQPCLSVFNSFRVRFNPALFGSTLPFRFNPVLFVVSLKASLLRSSPVPWSQTVLFVSSSFLYPILSFQPFPFRFDSFIATLTPHTQPKRLCSRGMEEGFRRLTHIYVYTSPYIKKYKRSTPKNSTKKKLTSTN